MKTMKKILFILSGGTSIILGIKLIYDKFYKQKKDMASHNTLVEQNMFFQQCYNLASEWVRLKQEKGDIHEWFCNHGISKIAIYGMGNLGWLLYDDIKTYNDIEVVCAYDINAAIMGNPMEMKTPNEMEDGIPGGVDAIIVTPFREYQNIRSFIQQYTDKPVYSIEDIIYSREV